MSGLSKSFSLLIILILVASNVVLVEPTFAQSISKPSIPTFTLRHVEYVTTIAPTYTFNPYTGQNEMTSSGSQTKREVLEFTINNQPFASFTDSNGNQISQMYNLRFKGHYGTTWQYYPFNPDGISSQHYGGIDFTYLVPISASNSGVTVTTVDMSTVGIPNNGEADFQVQAQIGYIQEGGNAFTRRVYGATYNFTGQSSDWSTTQTLNMNEVVTTSSPVPTQPTQISTPSPSPTVPEFSSLTIQLTIITMVVVAGSLVFFKKRRHHTEAQVPSQH